MNPLTIKSIDIDFYQKRLADFLPAKIIDIHTHIWKKTFVTNESDVNREKWPSRVADENPIEDLLDDYQRMLPGKEVTPCVFGNPVRSIDLEKNNLYVSEVCKQYGFSGLMVTTPQMNGDELVKLVETYGFIGLKPYLSYAPASIPEQDITIYDFLPRQQLEIANEKKWLIILHIPRPGRLRDMINIQQLMEIDSEYPQIRLVIAHIGRAYCDEDIGDAFDYLQRTNNLMMDFSANTNSNAMIEAIKALGIKRILFGSDMPILRMRMRRICEGGKYVNLVPPGLYGDIRADPHMREVSEEESDTLSFFLYEELNAFRKAADQLGLGFADIEDIFYRNAARILNL